jgi:hypothetical protein
MHRPMQGKTGVWNARAKVHWSMEVNDKASQKHLTLCYDNTHTRGGGHYLMSALEHVWAGGCIVRRGSIPSSS